MRKGCVEMRYTKRICSLLLATVLGISCFADTVSFAATKDNDEIVLSSETRQEETDEIEISSSSEDDDIGLQNTSEKEEIVLTPSSDMIVLKENTDKMSVLESSVSTDSLTAKTREEVVFHVKAVNDTESASEFRLYFLDVPFGQIKRADDKGKFLSSSSVNFHLLGVNEKHELPVEISVGRGGSLTFRSLV